MLIFRDEQLARIAAERQRMFVERLASRFPERELSVLARTVDIGLGHLRTERDLLDFTRIVLEYGLLVEGRLPAPAVRLLANPYASPARRLDSLESWARRQEDRA